jgi:DNA-binding transcriptional MerR regulator
MEMRVEQLSVQSGVAVDTIRYYQSKGLLEPPRREGRLAWYGPAHLERLARIRSLQERGFTLATISRLLSGSLDAADEALLAEVAASGGDPRDMLDDPADDLDQTGFTLAELAERTGVPLALLKAIEAEGLLVPRRIGGTVRYTSDDVAAAQAGLLLLEWGIPLSSLLDLARRHHRATEEVAREAVSLFSTYIRAPLRESARDDAVLDGGSPDDDTQVQRLLTAYAELLPAVDALVGHHFTRTLLKAALDHVEQTGSDEERRAVWEQIEQGGSDEGWRVEGALSTGSPS